MAFYQFAAVSGSISVFPAGKIPGTMPPVGPEVCRSAYPPASPPVQASPSTSATILLTRKQVCAPSFANSTTCFNVSQPTLVPFLVRGADVAVIVAPGGGFRGLAYSTEGTEVAAWLNGLGISAFVLKYRVPTAFDGEAELPLMDAQRALRLVRSRAAKYGLNASKLGFIGFSAGGDVAAGVSAAFAVDSYAKIDEIDAQSSRPDFTLLVYPAVHAWAGSITAQHPPAFCAQAEHDPVDAGATIEYYLKLRKTAFAPADLHIFHGDIHGYGLCTTRDKRGRIPALVANPSGPGLMMTWVPWTSVCLWPTMAEAFLRGQGLLAPHDSRTVQSSDLSIVADEKG